MPMARIHRANPACYKGTMKIAVVFLPKNGELNLSIAGEGRPARLLLLGRRKQLVVLGALLLCAAGLWFAGVMSTMMQHATAEPTLTADPAIVVHEEAPVAAPVAPVAPAPAKRSWLRQILARHEQPEPASRVLPFDGSRTLHRGDKVVVSVDGASMLAEIAGAPNESVLLRRGRTLERLYVLGDSSYAIIANQQSRVIHVADIFATVDAVAQVARN